MKDDIHIAEICVKRVTFNIPHTEWTQLKLMGILTNRSMTDFIRIAIKDKIKELKTD